MYIKVNVTKQTGTDENGYAIHELVDGYHIDSVINHTDLADYQIEPNSPQHTIAGAKTYHYKFTDETQARELMPQAFEDEFY